MDFQVDQLERIGVPVRYVLGNHDKDLDEATGDVVLPFHEAVRSHSGWGRSATPTSSTSTRSLATTSSYFCPPHQLRGTLTVSFEKVQQLDRTEKEKYLYYPHSEDNYRVVSERVADSDKSVITAGHTSFPGGNRPSEMQRRFFPLPDNVHVHFYSHANVGNDGCVAYDDHKNRFQTISYVDENPVPQLDVASLEDVRGDTVRSAVFEIYESGDYGAYFRDHSARDWVEGYLRSPPVPDNGTAARSG